MTSAASTLTRPASDGAHRLAWWIADAPHHDGDANAAVHAVALAAQVSPALIDRLLSGEVAPSGLVATGIAAATDGAVRPMDWERHASRAWMDRPVPRNDPA